MQPAQAGGNTNSSNSTVIKKNRLDNITVHNIRARVNSCIYYDLLINLYYQM